MNLGEKMIKEDIQVEKLKGQIEEWENKVTGLKCELESLSGATKQKCIEDINEINKKIANAMSEIEEIEKSTGKKEFPLPPSIRG